MAVKNKQATVGSRGANQSRAETEEGENKRPDTKRNQHDTISLSPLLLPPSSFLFLMPGFLPLFVRPRNIGFLSLRSFASYDHRTERTTSTPTLPPLGLAFSARGIIIIALMSSLDLRSWRRAVSFPLLSYPFRPIEPCSGRQSKQRERRVRASHPLPT